MARVAFIQEELRERFGIMILSSILKKAGHECDVFIDEVSKNVIQEALDYQPDVIAFSTMTPGIDFALQKAKEIKQQSDTFVMMGGPHPTFYPEVLKEEGIDGICMGEGEYPFLDFINAFEKKKDYTRIHNIWIKENGTIHKNDLQCLVQLDDLPMCDWELYFSKFPQLRAVPTKKVAIARGCPFDCAYCFNHALKDLYKGKGPYVRFYSVDRVISEIEHVRDKYGMKWFLIVADTVNLNRKWFMEFLEKYEQRVKIPFICNVRIDKVDEEMVRKMKEAGCDRVDYAIEHGNEDLLNKVLKRQMKIETIIENGKLFHKYDIRVQTSNIIGIPHETLETAFETIRVNQQVKPEIAKCCILQPYPKTEIHQYSIDHQFLDEDYGFSTVGNAFQSDFDGAKDSMPLNLEDKRRLKNLVYFFDLIVQHPWLEPLVRPMLNWPYNRFFKFIYAYPSTWLKVKYAEKINEKLRHISFLFKILFKKP